MGERGPVPKPDAQRAGHRAKNERARKLKTSAAVLMIPEPREEWHPAARYVFDAASLSSVSDLYDSAAWAMLVVLCDLLSAHYNSARPSAEMFKHAMALSSRLLLTTADQLRARIEMEHGGDDSGDDAGSDDVAARFAALRVVDGDA